MQQQHVPHIHSVSKVGWFWWLPGSYKPARLLDSDSDCELVSVCVRLGETRRPVSAQFQGKWLMRIRSSGAPLTEGKNSSERTLVTPGREPVGGGGGRCHWESSMMTRPRFGGRGELNERPEKAVHGGHALNKCHQLEKFFGGEKEAFKEPCTRKGHLFVVGLCSTQLWLLEVKAPICFFLMIKPHNNQAWTSGVSPQSLELNVRILIMKNLRYSVLPRSTRKTWDLWPH